MDIEIVTLLIFNFWVPPCRTTVCTKVKNLPHLANNYTLEGLPFNYKRVDGFFHCVEACKMLARCKAFTYNTFTNRCNMYPRFKYSSKTSDDGLLVSPIADWTKQITDVAKKPGNVKLQRDRCPVSKGYMSVYSPRLCFKLSEVSDTMTWTNAQRQCQSEGGRLIILDTEGKFDFIYQYMFEQKPGTAFVGMKKVGSAFKWTDGTDYVKQWGYIEPDFVSYQNCVAIWKSDGLGDTECNNARRYLCEVLVSG